MNARPLNVGTPGWPAEMMRPEVWRWFLAIIDWDWREPHTFASLLASGEAPPTSLARVISSIETGTRLPKSHRTVNAAHVVGADRMKIAREISYRLGLLDANKLKADDIAAKRATMAKIVLSEQKKLRRNVYEVYRIEGAFESVNVEALEDMVRELRVYARRWPSI